MYQWDKSIKSMGVPVEEVVHLYRSMRDVQLALPGLPAQEATAYLCQHRTQQGVGTVAAFHLHKSNLLAFYVDSPVVVAAGKADAMLEQTLMFVESMGFLMTDLDIHLLSAPDREMLWASLPLLKGIEPVEPSPAPKPVPIQKVPPQAKGTGQPSALQPDPGAETPAPKSASPDEALTTVVTAAGTEAPAELPGDAPRSEKADVDDLLAAVEELRTRRPGVPTRKKPPSPDELNRRRQELRQNLGRILASL